MLTNLKKPGAIFCLSPFPSIKKVYLEILKNLAQLFAYLLFRILKIVSSILTNFEKPGAIVCLSPFSNIKKSILTNLKKPGTIFACLLVRILKIKHLQILKNLAQFFAYPLFQIFKKVFLQI